MLVVVYRWKHANPIQAYEVKVLADNSDIFHLSSTLNHPVSGYTLVTLDDYASASAQALPMALQQHLTSYTVTISSLVSCPATPLLIVSL